LIVAAVVLVLFGGRGKLSGIMGDAAKGIRAFRDGLKDEHDHAPAAPPQSLPRAEPEKDPVVR
jgi:sec-independent protein translocase protein TatA